MRTTNQLTSLVFGRKDNIMKYTIEELQYLGVSELIEEIIILNKEIDILREVAKFNAKQHESGVTE